jgi:hypothetical protein
MEQVLKRLEPYQAHFGATHGGAELDLLLFKRGNRFGFEFKYEDAPGLAKSIHVALKGLGLKKICILPTQVEVVSSDDAKLKPL